VAPDHIIGTRFRYDSVSGEIASIVRLPAGYGKVTVVEELRAAQGLGQDRIVYVGDGSSDLHVMLHVNHIGGLTIAVSENRYIRDVAARSILSDDALSVLVPVLEDVLGWNSARIRSFFAAHGFALREWEKVRTDTITLVAAAPETAAQTAVLS
jgi:predicted HAD superfamily phosphohydrolase